jgi:uncharacterized damage-inducible protein DinB
MADPSTLFLNAARHFLADEYRVKLRTAVQAIPPDRLWWRPNDDCNSVGNLLVHLAGNLRQWMLAGVGGRPFTRNRAAEFAAREGAERATLLADLEGVLDDVDALLERLTPERLSERCAIQGRDITVLEAVFHVTEHFSTHLGQIILLAKMAAPGHVRFYDDAGGLAKPLWTPHKPPPSGDTPA